MCKCDEDHCALHGPFGSESQVRAWKWVIGRELRRIASATIHGPGVLVLGIGPDLIAHELGDHFPPQEVRLLTDDAAEIVRLWNELPSGHVILHPRTPEVEVWRPTGLERFTLVREVDGVDPDRPHHAFGTDARLCLPAGTRLRPSECGFELPTGEHLRLHTFGLVREGKDGKPAHPMRWGHVTPQTRAWRERTKWGPGGDAPTTCRPVEVVLPRGLYLVDDDVWLIRLCKEIERRVSERDIHMDPADDDAVIVVDLSDVAADI